MFTSTDIGAKLLAVAAAFIVTTAAMATAIVPATPTLIGTIA